MIDIELLRKIDRIHPYPAKFTVDLAMEYVKKYTKEDDLVYDPFLGSGTTLLACKNLNRNGVGTDINFIAILISKFKILDLSKERIEHLKTFIETFEKSYKSGCESVSLFEYPSINHWFCDDSIKVLSYIKFMIDSLTDDSEKIFCKLVMSAIINSASNQESDTRYAAVVKPKLNVDYVANLFTKKFLSTLSICDEALSLSNTLCKESPLLYNSKKCTDVIKKESVDLILTSPPYPNTYDYYLYHKHRMNWLGYDVKFSMNEEIGSRREFSSLKRPKEKFDDDMSEILSSCNNTLKVGGHVVLVMGDGQIQGEVYNAKENMIMICDKFNWKLIDYKFSYLDETSRSFQKSYRTKGKKEHILVFEKAE